MDTSPWTFLLYASPLAALAGVTFGIINYAFRHAWRLAQVEQRAASTDQRVTRMEEVLSCVNRIEVTVQQLVEDRRQATTRGRRSYDGGKEGA